MLIFSRLPIFFYLVLCAASVASPASAQGEQKDYIYDALGRLVTVERSISNTETIYTYDEAGNRISVIHGPAAPAQFSIGDPSVTEGGSLVFSVTKLGSPSQILTIDYATADGTAGSSDYSSRSGTLSFSSAEFTKNINVPTTDDGIFEGLEAVLLNISNPSGGALITKPQGVGNITNNDSAPIFSVNNVSREEGQNLTFTVTKNGESSQSHSVSYATQNVSATAGEDYTARSGTLTFSALEQTKSVTISGIEDTVGEQAEEFALNLSNATNGASISGTNGSGTGTITNDDNFDPIAQNNTYNDREWGVWYTFNVLGNDSDPDGDPLTISNAFTLHGEVQITSNNKALRYRCNGCGVLDAQIYYGVIDGNGGSDSATVFIYFDIGGGDLPL